MFVFRRYKKKQGKKFVRHPKLIVDSKDNQYGYLGLTESDKDGHHSNFKIKNPQKGKCGDSYLRKRIEYDYKRMFSEILDDYNLSKKDKEHIINYLNKHKKKK